MTRLARTLLLFALPTFAAAAVMLPRLAVRLEYLALSPGDPVTTRFDGTGEVEAVGRGFVVVRTARGTFRVPAGDVTER